MEFKHKSGIYMCTCSGNNKSYIGQAQDVKLRKCQHLSELRGKCHFNQYLQNSYNKYKEYSFSWTVLEYCDESELDEREIYWIAYYDTYKNGFNANEGGSGNRGYKRSEETNKKASESIKKFRENASDMRQEFSERMRGENNPMYGRTGSLNPAYRQDHSGERGGMYGKHHTEEAKELNRQAHLGLNNKMSKPVVCIETGEIFASQGEVKRKTGISDTSVNKCLKGVKKTAGGYHWRYATQEEIYNITHIA